MVKNNLQAKIQTILEKALSDILQLATKDITEKAKVLPLKPPPNSHVLGPVQKLPAKIERPNNKRILIEVVHGKYMATLPDGRIWSRKRERELRLKLKRAGFEAYSLRSIRK